MQKPNLFWLRMNISHFDLNSKQIIERKQNMQGHALFQLRMKISHFDLNSKQIIERESTIEFAEAQWVWQNLKQPLRFFLELPF